MAAAMEVDTLAAPPTQRSIVTSVYKRMQSYPQEGRGPIVVPADGSLQSTFLLPSNQVINMYRSYLTFSMAFTSGANQRVVLRADRVPFSAVALMAGGVELFNIPKDADLLTAALNPVITTFDDYVADGWCDGEQSNIGHLGTITGRGALTGLQWVPYGQWQAVVGGAAAEIAAIALDPATGTQTLTVFCTANHPRRYGGVLCKPGSSIGLSIQTPAIPQVDNGGSLPFPNANGQIYSAASQEFPAAYYGPSFRNPSSPYPIMHIWVQALANMAAAEGSVNWEIPLHRLAPHTILTYDKDMIFPITPELRLVWAPMNAVSWLQGICATDADPGGALTTNPVGNQFFNAGGQNGGLAVARDPGAWPDPGSLGAANAATVTGLQLDIAVNYDVGLIASMQSQLSGPGFTMRLPWPIMQDRVINSGSTGTNDFKLNPNLGSNLLRIYNFVAWTDSGARITTARRNIEAGGPPGTKLVNLRTNMAGSPLQQEAVTFDRRGSAWKFMKPLLTGSAIQSWSDWIQNGGVWVDEFANGVDPVALSRQVTDWADAGVALDRDMFYQCELEVNDFPANVSARMIMVLIVQKELQITSGGIVVRA